MKGFQENFKKSFKGVSRMFQCSFVAWISSQLPEQKKGLLCCYGGNQVKIKANFNAFMSETH